MPPWRRRADATARRRAASVTTRPRQPRQPQRRGGGEQAGDVRAHADPAQHPLDDERSGPVDGVDHVGPQRVELVGRRGDGERRAAGLARQQVLLERRRPGRVESVVEVAVDQVGGGVPGHASDSRSSMRARIMRVLTVPARDAEQRGGLAGGQPVEDGGLHDGAQLGRQVVQRVGQVAVLDAGRAPAPRPRRAAPRRWSRSVERHGRPGAACGTGRSAAARRCPRSTPRRRRGRRSRPRPSRPP